MGGDRIISVVSSIRLGQVAAQADERAFGEDLWFTA